MALRFWRHQGRVPIDIVNTGLYNIETSHSARYVEPRATRPDLHHGDPSERVACDNVFSLFSMLLPTSASSDDEKECEIT
jgi:hypothetical protein